MLLIVEYENLCKDPRNVIKLIYGFLELEWFEHDFENVEYENELFDRPMGQPGLHTVKKKVEWKERQSVLPPSIWKKYGGQEFWRESKEKELKYE